MSQTNTALLQKKAKVLSYPEPTPSKLRSRAGVAVYTHRCDMSTLGDTPFRLGEWTVRPRQNRIERKGTTKSLEPKLVEVLVYLAAAPGETKLRQEILDSVWKDTFVTDEVLTNAVFELRRALNDSARDPSYIETIPRKGYRLVAEVCPVDSPPGSSRPSFASKAIVTRLRLTFLLVALGAAALLLWSRSPTPTPDSWPESIAVLPIEALSEDTAHREFARALTDTLTTELAAGGMFQLPSRATVDELVAQGVPATEISDRLRVDAFLEGTLSFSESGRARLSSQLIDRRADRHLWARIFEADVRQNLEAERRLSRQIALQLAASAPQSAELGPPPKAPTTAAFDQKVGAGWRFRTGDEVWAPGTQAGSNVLIASDDGNLYALSRESGREVWRYSTPEPIRDEATLEGDSIFLSICNYVVSLDSSTGEEQWRQLLSAISPVTATPTALLVGSYDRHLYGLDPADGSTRWKIPTQGENRTAAVSVGNLVIVGTNEGELLVVDPATGTAKVRTSLGSAVVGIATSDQKVLVSTDNGYLYHLSMEGEEIWRRPLGSRPSVAPLIDRQMIVQGTGDGRVMALDLADGKELWSTTLRDAVGATPVLDTSDPSQSQLLVPSLDHHLYALDPLDGRELWRYSADGWVVTRPLLVDDLVVFADLSGVVYAIPRDGSDLRHGLDEWPEAGSPRVLAAESAAAPTLLWGLEVPEHHRLAADSLGLYVSTSRGVTALDAEGGERWTFAAVGGVLGAPLALEDQLVVASRPGTLHALEPSTGREQWRTDLSGELVANPRADDTHLYIGDRKGLLHAVERSTGEVTWSSETSGFINGAAERSRDLVLVGSCGEEVWAFGAERGELRWTTHAGECVVTDGLALGEVAVFGNYSGDLLALDLETGARRWTFRADGEHIWYRPVPHANEILFGSGDYRLYSVDASSGVERWHFQTGNRVLSEIDLHEDREGRTLVLFGSHDRHLYGLEADQGTEVFRIETTRDVQNLLVHDRRLYFLGDQDYLYAYDLP